MSWPGRPPTQGRPLNKALDAPRCARPGSREPSPRRRGLGAARIDPWRRIRAGCADRDGERPAVAHGPAAEAAPAGAPRCARWSRAAGRSPACSARKVRGSCGLSFSRLPPLSSGFMRALGAAAVAGSLALGYAASPVLCCPQQGPAGVLGLGAPSAYPPATPDRSSRDMAIALPRADFVQ